MPAPRQNTAAEIDALQALCDRLGGFDDRISLEWVDGYFTALLAGPRTLTPGEWLMRIFGDAWDRALADPRDVEKGLECLMARWNVLADQLNPEHLIDAQDEMRLTPLMSVLSDEDRARLLARGQVKAEDLDKLPATGAIWALGFANALEDFADEWTPSRSLPGEEQEWFDGCLARVLALALVDADELTQHFEAHYEAEALDRDTLIDEARFAVQDLRLFWLDHAPRPATRQVAAEPGRNDACPCGSGKKYKKCHGAG